MQSRPQTMETDTGVDSIAMGFILGTKGSSRSKHLGISSAGSHGVARRDLTNWGGGKAGVLGVSLAG
jgi:hypothetical protein